ncbi:hypothetical protein GN958_ATG08752, partial [Phytophthora infestans]
MFWLHSVRATGPDGLDAGRCVARDNERGLGCTAEGSRGGTGGDYFNLFNNWTLVADSGRTFLREAQSIETEGSMGELHTFMVASVFPEHVGVRPGLRHPPLGPCSRMNCCLDPATRDRCTGSTSFKLLTGHAIAESYEKLLDAAVDDEKERAEYFELDLDPVLEVIASTNPILLFVYETEDRMREQWRPAYFRTIKTGHVSGILLKQETNHKTILEVVDLLKKRRP